MSYVWRRQVNVSALYNTGSWWIDAIPAGATYVRQHFRWGISGDTSDAIDLSLVTSNLITMGLVTTVGNGTETPPNARTAAFDASPPTQRWIYWETRAPIVQQFSPAGGVALWRDSGSTEFTQTKGQVLATGMPVGDTLNLFASWAAPGAWDPSGLVQVWMGISTLVKMP